AGAPRCPRSARSSGPLAMPRRRSGGAPCIRPRVGAPFLTSPASSRPEQSVDSITKVLPLPREGRQRTAASRGERVVAARRPGGRLAPGRLDRALATKPPEERIQRPLGGHEAVDVRQCPHELEAVALAVLQEREDAVLEHAPAELGRPV